MKKHLLIITIIFILLAGIQNIVLAENTTVEDVVENTTIKINLNEMKINDEPISEDNTKEVYFENGENNQKIIKIKTSGDYEISGKNDNVQLVLEHEASEKTIITLNNVNLTSKKGPAIIIEKGFEFFEADTAGVVLNILEGTENKIIGSYIENENQKYEGAISSNTSLEIKGGGKLNIVAEKEGIETKRNLVINNGNIRISSKANAVDAYTENESEIIINNGEILLNVDKTEKEANGLNAAHKIKINGGKLYTFAEEKGINSKNVLEVNGGTFIAKGDISESYSKTESKQLAITLKFKNEQKNGTLVTLTKIDNTPLFAYSAGRNFESISVSMPELKEDTYKVYLGGTIIGDLKNNFYTNITTYSVGEEQKVVEQELDKVEFKFSRENTKIENLEKVVVQTNVVEEVADGDFSAIICLGIALIILITLILINKKTEQNKKTS